MQQENSRFWHLENLNAMGVFCQDKLMTKSALHTERVFKKGDYIYQEADASDYLYILMRGRVKIGSYGEGDKEVIKAVVSKGEVFGELALISDGGRREFAQAMEETEVCIIAKQNMKLLFRERSSIQNFFLNLFGNRLLEAETRFERLVFKDSRSRIIDFLLDLIRDRGEPVGVETVVRKFLTHQEIANITATSRQTVTTVLNDLREKNIITFDRRRLLVRDKERLIKST